MRGDHRFGDRFTEASPAAPAARAAHDAWARDIRRFHNALLDQGAVPLPVLERIVDEWIAAPAAKPG